MGAVGKIIDGIFVPFGENNRQQFIGTSEEIQANIESGQLQNGDTVFNNDNNKSVGRIENDEYVPYTGGDTTVDFTESETRENIEPINPLKNILGKIRRWFSDIGDAAFANIVNNRTTTEPGFVADARQLKELQDQIDAQNSTLENIDDEPIKIITMSGSVIDLFEKCRSGLNVFICGGSSVGLPSQTTEWKYGCGLLFKRSGDEGTMMLFGYNSTKIAICPISNKIAGSWRII